MSGYDDEDMSDERSNSSSIWPEVSDAATQFKEKLLEHLSDITSSGTFATSASVSEFVNPGISVDGLSILRLPASVEDVKSIIQHSQQAPFGKDSDTIIDTSVRKAWQIDAVNIQCCNPRWQKFLEKITIAACENLAVPEPSHVRAYLYKMLIYEEGGKFEAHQDTERQEGMFATLIICLPSQHSGGDVVLQHNGETITINTSADSTLNASYLAWYADVMHTVEEVTGGYRLALSYSLINTQAQSLRSATDLTERSDRLIQILEEWDEELQKEIDCLLIPLQHQYSGQSLQLSMLKGKDYHMSSEVVDVCNARDQQAVFLAKLEKSSTVPDGDMFRDKDSKFRLISIYDTQGLELVIDGSPNVSRESFIRNPYKGRLADAQTGGGYMGNEPAELIELYKDCVLILVPAPRFTQWLYGLDSKPHKVFASYISSLAQRASRQSQDDHHMQAWQACCRRVFDESTGFIYDRDADLGSVASTAVLLNDLDMFRAAVEHLRLSFRKEDCQHIAEQLTPGNVQSFWDSAEQMMDKNGYIHVTLQNIEAFENGLTKSNFYNLDGGNWDTQSWQRKLTDLASRSMTNCVHIYPSDPEALVHLIEMREARPQEQSILSEDVRGLLSNNVHEGHFITTFAAAVFVRSTLSAGAQTHLSQIVDSILPGLVEKFDLNAFLVITSVEPAPKQTKSGKTRRLTNMVMPWSGSPLIRRRVAKLFNHIRQRDVTLLASLLVQIRIQVGVLNEEMLSAWLMPILSATMDHADVAMSQVRPCVAQLLDYYIAQRCHTEPVHPEDWNQAYAYHFVFPEEKQQPYDDINTFLSDKDAEILDTKYDFSADLSQLQRTYPQLRFQTDSSGMVCIVRKTLDKWAREYKIWQRSVQLAKRDLATGCCPLIRLQSVVPGYDLVTSIPQKRRFLEDDDPQDIIELTRDEERELMSLTHMVSAPIGRRLADEA